MPSHSVSLTVLECGSAEDRSLSYLMCVYSSVVCAAGWLCWSVRESLRRLSC